MVAALACATRLCSSPRWPDRKTCLPVANPIANPLAASYASGIARNHPFVDGNKRTAFVVSATFLEMNGWRVQATEPDVVTMFLALASGDLAEDALAAWFGANSRAA